MANADKTRLIEAYYRGNLKGVDKSYFKQLMREDPDFKQEVKDYKSIFNGLEALHLEQFQGQMAHYEAQYEGNVVAMNHRGAVRSLKKFYYVAAAVVLLICATVGYNALMPTVYEANFAATESIAVHMASVRGDEEMSAAEKLKKSAFSAYQRENFNKCIDELNDYINTYPEAAAKDYQSMLVLGVAQLASDDAQKAEKNLYQVMTSKDSSYRQEAQWMWVMAQFKLGKGSNAECVKVLEMMIQQKGHIHQAAAKKILNRVQ